MPTLSIIIPVYNVEPYLDECIRSVSRQSFHDIEIICVDDGSTDRSPIILDQWSQSDNRIKVIHKTNSGVSSSRNVGLRSAKGRYVTFVDADDYVRDDIYLVSQKLIDNNNLDILIFAFESIPNNYIVKTGFPINQVLSYHQLFSSNSRIQSRNALCYNWRFVFRADILKDNSIFFDESISIGEDMVFNIEAICHAKRIMAIDDALYFYRRNNPNSAMSKGYKPGLEDSLHRMYQHKLRQLKDYQLDIHNSYVNDLAIYTVSVYLKMLLDNLYSLKSGKCHSNEIKRILSLPYIRYAYRIIGNKNVYSSKTEYLFYLLQKYRVMIVVTLVYNRYYGR